MRVYIGMQGERGEGMKVVAASVFRSRVTVALRKKMNEGQGTFLWVDAKPKKPEVARWEASGGIDIMVIEAHELL